MVRHTTRMLIHTASQRRHHGNPFSTPPSPQPTVDEDYHRPTAVTVAVASGGSVYEVAGGRRVHIDWTRTPLARRRRPFARLYTLCTILHTTHTFIYERTQTRKLEMTFTGHRIH